MKLTQPTTSDPQQQALQRDFFAPDLFSPDLSAAPASSLSPQPDPAPAATPPGQRRIQLGTHTLDYRLLRSTRRSIGFLIDDAGLRITAPKWVTLADIDQAIREKQRWILSKLGERRDRATRSPPPAMRWCDGATLPYLGGTITLRLRADAQRISIAFNTTTAELTVSLPTDASEQQLKDRVQGWLQREAHRVFAERLPLYAAKLAVTVHSFRLSSARTRWGSCTADGRIRLNWRLIYFALAQIDYVIAHELSHRREMNHSPRFWATVQSVFPEFEAARKALRERSTDTLPVF